MRASIASRTDSRTSPPPTTGVDLDPGSLAAAQSIIHPSGSVGKLHINHDLGVRHEEIRRQAALCLIVLCLLLVSALQQAGTASAQVDSLGNFNHMTSFGYLNTQEIPDEEQARFVAEHYDIWRGQANYSDLLLELNPNIILTWGLNVRAIANPAELEVWAAQHPEYDPEEYYLHYKYDTHIETDYGPLDVPGYNPECWPDCPNSSADSLAQSRVPDITNVGWMVPNPLSRGLSHIYADAIYARNAWYGNVRSVLWDWGAGFCLHIDDKLENTWEYEGQQSDSWFLHPSIDDFISIIDTVSVKYQELHPDLPPLLAIANGVAGFWMYDWADGNDYRRALLGSNAVDLIWQEMGVVFGERNQPNSHYLHTILHLKYMKDIPVVMERKRVGLQVRVRDSEPTDRDKLFVLGYAYLFNDRDRMAITYVAEGQDGNPNYDLETSHWAGPAMEFDIGQPVVNPPGVRDINGHENTNVFYEWARGEDPGNDWQTYTIFARQYENVMVLVKVRESADAVWDETTETTHSLGRLWSPLRADGTLGDPVTSITLKNNEAAILVAVNSPPFLEAPLSKTIPEGEELAFTVHAYDCDQYDDLALSATNMPPGADFIDNHDRTGTFRWTPNYFQEGVHPGIRFDVTDGEAIFSRELTITVTDVEQPPAGAPDMPAAPATPGFYLKNPYRAGSSIVLWSANVDHSDVEIFDVFGRKVRSLHVGLGATSGADAGRGVMRPLAVSWDGRNDAGGKVRAGVYILRAQGAAGRLQRKLILIER